MNTQIDVTYLMRTLGHKPNPAHSKAYQIAEALYPEKPPQRADVTKFHKAALLKSLGFPGFENIDDTVQLSAQQEQKLVDAGNGPNSVTRVNEMKNRMLLERSFAKSEPERMQVATGNFSKTDGKQEFEEKEVNRTASMFRKPMDF